VATLVGVEERLARLETQVEDLRGLAHEIDVKMDTVQSTLDRRLGVEALGKFIAPFLAVAIAGASLWLNVVH
jgi:hypothetical protein